MKIVIDLQGVQAESRNRGIGRYSLSLAKAMVRHKREHEIIIALNGMFPQSLEPIRAAFAGVLPPENIRVWNAVGPTTPLAPENAWRNDVAELAREAFLLDLKPDFVHVSSPFEGFGDNAVFSLGRLPYPLRTAVTLYDLIPFMEKEVYLDPNPTFAGFYHKRIDYLRRADLFLAISESARREVIECLGVEEYKAVNISAAADDYFRPCKLSLDERRELHKAHGISKPFVLYSGATDERKNHLRLIRAFAAMPKPLRNKYQLVLAGSLPDEHRMAFRREAAKAGLGDTDLVITGRITDNALVGLYGTCELFVFPSWHEGFGLPALEAMCCGAAVIGSDTSSVPEVVGLAQARFDPFSESSISAKMAEVLADPQALRALRDYSTERAKDFSWDICARRTIDALEAALPERTVPRASEQPDYDQAV
ncbi:MAG: glycosyltransferase family 4 protein, partial [Asticcacaulis sp.]